MCQQEKSRKKNGPFAHGTSVAVAPSSQLMLGAYDSGHTATLRSAQIRQSRTSYIRRTLGEICHKMKRRNYNGEANF